MLGLCSGIMLGQAKQGQTLSLHHCACFHLAWEGLICFLMTSRHGRRLKHFWGVGESIITCWEASSNCFQTSLYSLHLAVKVDACFSQGLQNFLEGLPNPFYPLLSNLLGRVKSNLGPFNGFHASFYFGKSSIRRAPLPICGLASRP